MTRLLVLAVLFLASAFATQAPLAEMVEIKGGKFMMGDKAEPDATPQHWKEFWRDGEKLAPLMVDGRERTPPCGAIDVSQEATKQAAEEAA